MKIGIGLPFKTSRDSWPAIEALARKADQAPCSSFAVIDRLAYDDPARLEARVARANLTTPEAIREAIAFHRELGTDELILKPATLAPDQADRLTEVVAKEL